MKQVAQQAVVAGVEPWRHLREKRIQELVKEEMIR